MYLYVLLCLNVSAVYECICKQTHVSAVSKCTEMRYEPILSVYTQLVDSHWFLHITLYGNITLFGDSDIRSI